jgi:hypothetical protein
MDQAGTIIGIASTIFGIVVSMAAIAVKAGKLQEAFDNLTREVAAAKVHDDKRFAELYDSRNQSCNDTTILATQMQHLIDTVNELKNDMKEFMSESRRK